MNMRICQNMVEVNECLHLVYQSYVRAGFISPNVDEIHSTMWHNLPDTAIVRAEYDGELVATVTCIFENQYIGMPCSELFQDQIDETFGPRDLLAEMSCIASVGPDHNREVMQMLRWGRDWLLDHGVTAVMGCVHPHHAKFWISLMGAVSPREGDVRTYYDLGADAVWGYMTRESVAECNRQRRRDRVMHNFANHLPPVEINELDYSESRTK